MLVKSVQCGKRPHCCIVTLAAANAFVLRVRWAGTFTRGGRRSRHNALMRRCVTVGRHMSPQKCPFPWGDLDRIQYMVLWTRMSQPPNGISIGSAVFAQLTRLPNTQTHIDHATCDVCSSRPHLCTACRRRGLKWEAPSLSRFPCSAEVIASCPLPILPRRRTSRRIEDWEFRDSWS